MKCNKLYYRSPPNDFCNSFGGGLPNAGLLVILQDNQKSSGFLSVTLFIWTDPFFTKDNTMYSFSRKQYHNLTAKPSFTAQGIERVSDTMGWASISGGGTV